MRERLKNDCLYATYRNQKRLISNTGRGDRGKGKVNATNDLNKLSEPELEWRLCKDGTDANCLKKTFNTGNIYRQFPVGVFHGKKPHKNNALFPGGKACVDLVADGEKKSFWIFELKKKKNIPLGILSELLFYVKVVRDMIAGRITPWRPTDKDCYNPAELTGKEIINACFLAPEFHPLLMETIINQLNGAFVQLKKRDNMCSVSVVFHKAILGMDNNGKLKVTRIPNLYDESSCSHSEDSIRVS
jgi:hypothetical protein